MGYYRLGWLVLNLPVLCIYFLLLPWLLGFRGLIVLIVSLNLGFLHFVPGSASTRLFLVTFRPLLDFLLLLRLDYYLDIWFFLCNLSAYFLRMTEQIILFLLLRLYNIEVWLFMLLEIIWKVILFGSFMIFSLFVNTFDYFIPKSYYSLQEGTIPSFNQSTLIESSISSLLQFLLNSISVIIRKPTDRTA